MAGDSTNTILLQTSQMHHHTDLGLVFGAFGGLQRRYNWLLSGNTEVEKDGGPQWLTRVELSAWIERRGAKGYWTVHSDNLPADAVERQGWEVYWGVLSGFESGLAVDPATAPVPYVEGNWDFWKPYPKPQHPQAAVEVVCFRGMLTLLLSRDAQFPRRSRAALPDALDLDEHVRPWLASWADAARRMPPGVVVTATVARAGVTTATVPLAPHVEAEIAVEQVRAAGFGPAH